MPNASTVCDALYAQFYALTRNVDVYNIFGICYGTSINPAEEFSKKGKRASSYKDYTPWAYPDNEWMQKMGLLLVLVLLL